MESPAVGLLPAQRPSDGFNSEKHKRSNVVDHSNPYAVADLIDGPNHGKFGSVTKDIESLTAQKMQTLSPIFAKDPALLQSAKVGMNRNEEAAKGCVEKIKLKHQNLKVEVMPSWSTILAALTCFGAILAILSAMVVLSEQHWLLPVAFVSMSACFLLIIVSLMSPRQVRHRRQRHPQRLLQHQRQLQLRVALNTSKPGFSEWK